MPIAAGRFRHRIRIEKNTPVQVKSGPGAGSMAPNWAAIVNGESVPAIIEPLRGSEFIAANAVNSQITSKIIIRWRSDIDKTMRLVEGSKIYNPIGWMVDARFGLEYLTSYATEGVNEG